MTIIISFTFISLFSGIIMTWEQWTQTVITTGDTRVIRFWDAERELKAFDLLTGKIISTTIKSVAADTETRVQRGYMNWLLQQ